MRKTFAVVMHSGGSGYVVRTVFDGWLPAPYTNAQREREYKFEKVAQKAADRMNESRA